ncbi:MAG: lmo0937 family membrane protein [Bacteroidales bacterium]|nr:lmo0937 family membrane protein [Bacteroidales bacterium]MDD4683605.1 lmo0937 family membrane protein [Bacteroidales bacterium]
MLAVILVIAWLVGLFAFQLGNLIHILLVIAIIAVLLRLIRGSAK